VIQQQRLEDIKRKWFRKRQKQNCNYLKWKMNNEKKEKIKGKNKAYPVLIRRKRSSTEKQSNNY